MKCEQCGTEMPEGQTACPICGAGKPTASKKRLFLIGGIVAVIAVVAICAVVALSQRHLSNDEEAIRDYFYEMLDELDIDKGAFRVADVKQVATYNDRRHWRETEVEKYVLLLKLPGGKSEFVTLERSKEQDDKEEHEMWVWMGAPSLSAVMDEAKSHMPGNSVPYRWH